jgi:hypothetical protein
MIRRGDASVCGAASRYHDGEATMRKRHVFILITILTGLHGCTRPHYDASSPQAALNSMYQMIAEGRPEMLGTMIHIQARDITYPDGVTEASAIHDVTNKAGEMLGQLYRVAGKLRQKFPNQIENELGKAAAAKRDDLDLLTKFLADPFGLMDQQRGRISVEDLGDGTAAILLDGKPALGAGLLMREVEGEWKVEIPIDLLQKYRPNTREEWAVIANMMPSLEKAFTAFETELDQGQFRDLQAASARAGRLLGERAVVQAIIYQGMKTTKPDEKG